MTAVDIASWLEELGLERYEQAFRDNAIDAEILPELTEADLEKLGVVLGHRKRLLRAIADLRAGVTSPAPSPKAAAGVPEGRGATEAERRQLTVLFCDLVGSTALSARLDPEDMGQVIRAYQDCCTAAVERWSGHVAKYMGDGVLAYFGWPQAHEDEAERAVRAGLDVVAAVSALAAPGLGGGREKRQPLAARVGIATGLVMVGELIGEGAAQEEAAVGETPNLAARLQALAAPGRVVISQATRRLVGGLFEFADLGPRRLRGFAEPLAAFRVEGEGRAEGRFEALHGERLTPLVGREHELALLLERWAWAKDGNGQVVLLSGEPGIGKSRLIRTLRERLGDEPYTPLSHFCSPYHINSALYPVIGLLERAARLDRDEPPEVQLARVEAVLAEATQNLSEVVPLLAALLGVPTGERYPALTLTPEMQKRRTLQALVDQLADLAAQQPVLALYEDAHWIDPSTLELVGLVIERVQRLPVLAVITFRPEFQAPRTGQAHVTSLTLSRLGQRQGAAMVQRITGGKSLPDDVLQQILLKTDGVPLFVEELTKTVLESGLLADQGDRYELFAPLPPLAIPTTLHDSLMARLDRVSELREVAQTAACIGREFAYPLLAAVSDVPPAKLHAALDGLVAAELAFCRGAPPEATYVFKHALVRDAAHESLLKGKRRELHTRIARALEVRFPAQAEAQPELLAYHCAEAKLTEKAVGYWHKAGRRAIERSASTEAVAHLYRALEGLASLPEDRGRLRKELGLQIELGTALIAARGFAAAETGRAYARARELCEQSGDYQRLVPVLYGQALFHMDSAEHRAAREAAEGLLGLAQDQNDMVSVLIGHRLAGTCRYLLGEFASARAHLEQALTLDDPEHHRSLGFVYAVDPRVAALDWLHRLLFFIGHPDQAQVRCREGLAEARDIAHAHSLAYALHGASQFHQIRRDRSSVEHSSGELLSLCAAQGFPYHQAAGLMLRGWAFVEAGQLETGLAQIHRGLGEYRATRTAYQLPYYLGLLADAYRRAGRVSDGFSVTDEAAKRVQRTDERWYEAELHRLRGGLLLSVGTSEINEAEACFQRALSVAREQSARMFELRAARDLAECWAEQGERQRARDLLAPVYAWFTEGFDTADLKEAKALLDQLA